MCFFGDHEALKAWKFISYHSIIVHVTPIRLKSILNPLRSLHDWALRSNECTFNFDKTQTDMIAQRSKPSKKSKAWIINCVITKAKWKLSGKLNGKPFSLSLSFPNLISWWLKTCFSTTENKTLLNQSTLFAVAFSYHAWLIFKETSLRTHPQAITTKTFFCKSSASFFDVKFFSFFYSIISKNYLMLFTLINRFSFKHFTSRGGGLGVFKRNN